jgi:hypothetical protein
MGLLQLYHSNTMGFSWQILLPSIFFFIIWIKRMSFSFGRGGVLKNVLLSMLVYCLTVVTYFSIVEWYTWLPLSVFSLSMEFILVNIQL